MPSLASLMEDYRNWRGRQDWEQGKGWQDFFGGDPRAQEQLEKLSGFGTDAGGLVGMIKASHGSPHMFDKFDFSKIGTGEGAQAYGHGGYFAQGFDSPVAKQYKDALAGVEVDGKVVKPEWHDPAYYPLQAIRKHGGDIEKAKADVYARNAKIPGGWPEELVAFEDLAKKDIKENQGHLYNVELKWPDAAREAADPLGEHHLLDWDAPMVKQSPTIQKAWLETQKDLPANAVDDLGGDLSLLYGKDVTPDEFLGTLSSIGGTSGFGESLLRKRGIPGIRYLDQGSRSAGTGSRNYVMFDDQIPEIVSRNGVSLSDLLKR